jgi:hypothetical protein
MSSSLEVEQVGKVEVVRAVIVLERFQPSLLAHTQ